MALEHLREDVLDKLAATDFPYSVYPLLFDADTGKVEATVTGRGIGRSLFATSCPNWASMSRQKLADAIASRIRHKYDHDS